jgi:Arc/MetJ family transcription regulator
MSAIPAADIAASLRAHGLNAAADAVEQMARKTVRLESALGHIDTIALLALERHRGTTAALKEIRAAAAKALT